jgi:2-succinyl-6-hydroxy-2,4-cyclohexadiene-1-carboxylate synthase
MSQFVTAHDLNAHDLNAHDLNAHDLNAHDLTVHDLTVRGASYHVAEMGQRESGQREAVLLLHGFTGCHANWHAPMAALSARHRVIAVDLLGHGRTDAPGDPARYAMEHAAADLMAVMTALAEPRFHLLGYSMGGRLALFTALTYGERVRSLVLESASPGLAGADERAARARADEALAASIERDGIAAFVTRWEALPLFASQAHLPDATRARLRAQRLANRPIGLANSLRGMGTGVQPSLWPQLPQVHTPVLLVTGAEDGKFCAIGRQMAEQMPQAQHATIDDAGHTVHLEQPAEYLRVVNEFLRKQNSEATDESTAKSNTEPQMDTDQHG